MMMSFHFRDSKVRCNYFDSVDISVSVSIAVQFDHIAMIYCKFLRSLFDCLHWQLVCLAAFVLAIFRELSAWIEVDYHCNILQAIVVEWVNSHVKKSEMSTRSINFSCGVVAGVSESAEIFQSHHKMLSWIVHSLGTPNLNWKMRFISWKIKLLRNWVEFLIKLH